MSVKRLAVIHCDAPECPHMYEVELKPVITGYGNDFDQIRRALPDTWRIVEGRNMETVSLCGYACMLRWVLDRVGLTARQVADAMDRQVEPVELVVIAADRPDDT